MTTAEAASSVTAVLAAKAGLVADHPFRHELDKFATAIDGCARGRAGGPTMFVGTGTGTAIPFLVGTTSVANLPAAAAGNTGQEYIVSDATTATNGGTVVGGSTFRVLVRSNGSDWLIV